MRKPSLLLVESNTSGTGRLFARRARELGFSPIVLSASPERYAFLAEDEVAAVCADTSSPEALARVAGMLQSTCVIRGVTSSSEYFVATAARLAASLGLAGPDAGATARCRDKHYQRVRCHAAGLPVPRFVEAGSLPAASAAFHELGGPVVVKPVDGTGSAGVRLCACEKEAVAHAEALLSGRRNERGVAAAPRILLEEYLDGEEFSVELFSSRAVGVTGKHLGSAPFFVETGHDFPCALDSARRSLLEQTAVDAAHALHLGWGPLHVELRWTARGPVLIEINPRLAGGFIPELVRRAQGIDLIEQTLRLATGETVDLAPRRRRYASIRFVLPPSSGELEHLHFARAAQLPCVEECLPYKPAGSIVGRFGDFRDRIGHVIAVADDAAQAAHAAEAALRAVDVRIVASAGVAA